VPWQSPVRDLPELVTEVADRGALAGCDPALYLNLGTGLAVAIVAGGTVLAGRHGASGEIGYNLRDLGDVGRGLDDRTPLEATVSGGALLAAAGRVSPGITGAAFFGAVAEDPALAGVLDEFLTELSFHLVNLAVAVDPNGTVLVTDDNHRVQRFACSPPHAGGEQRRSERGDSSGEASFAGRHDD